MVTELQTTQGTVRVPEGTWSIDPTHSTVGFEVKHMMISTVRGRFSDFEGTLEAASDLSNSRAYGTVKVQSIDTGESDRDNHLRSPDFFDAEQYPEMRFESRRIENLQGGNYRILGELTIKDETRKVEFDATVEGAAEDPWGSERVGVAVRGSVNRRDFGLKWQQLLETGRLLVGDEVTVVIDISAVKAK